MLLMPGYTVRIFRNSVGGAATTKPIWKKMWKPPIVGLTARAPKATSPWFCATGPP